MKKGEIIIIMHFNDTLFGHNISDLNYFICTNVATSLGSPVRSEIRRCKVYHVQVFADAGIFFFDVVKDGVLRGC